MKRKILFLGILSTVLLAVAGGVVLFGTGKARAASLSPDAAQRKLDALTESWWQSLNGRGWLYIKYEIYAPNSVGKDPDTGWELFKRAKEEIWSLSNGDGEVQVVLIKTVDEEHPDHVYRLAWEKGRLLREPGFRGDAPDWQNWDYHFILDSGCAREVREVAQSGDEATKRTEILSKEGKYQWEVTLTQYFPSPVQLPEMSTKDLFTASRLICTWNTHPAHLVDVTHFYVSEEGKEVLSEQISGFEAHRVKELPADMQALLNRLEAQK